MSDGLSDLSRNGIFGKGGYDEHDAHLASRPDPVPAKDLHLHYTAAQLEIALLRAKSARIDKQINELKEMAEKLKAEISTKEKA